MTTEIRFHGVRYSAALHDLALRLVDARLRRVMPPATRVVIWISDVNGPRGGADKRCRIVLLGPGMRPASVQSRSTDAYDAVRACFARAARVAVRELARTRFVTARTRSAIEPTRWSAAGEEAKP